MSHFSHTNVYFIREDEEDSNEEMSRSYLAAAEFEADSDDDSEMDDDAV